MIWSWGLKMKAARDIDVACMGRVAVDFYGQQIGASLSDTRSFARYLGGSSGNTAVSAARAGARSAMIGTVGNDPQGGYLLDTLTKEGVDITCMRRLPGRRTAMVFLAMRDAEADSLDFYRENAADSEIGLENVPQGFLDRVAFLSVNGTHIADPGAWNGVAPVLHAARDAGCRLVLDLDYRQDLWAGYPGGLQAAMARLQQALPLMQIVVGNQLEFDLFGDNPIQAIRALTGADLVLKRGADGAAWYGSGQDTVTHDVPGLPIDVVNPVGAGDAFLGNLLAGLCRTGSGQEAFERANAAGALVATRHGCSIEMPFPSELDRFLETGDARDPTLDELHHALSRPAFNKPVLALACDHREPFKVLSKKFDRNAADVRKFKALVHQAMRATASGLTDARPGMLMDNLFGADVLLKLSQDAIWTGRPIEVTGSRPIGFEADPGLAAYIASWQPGQVAKVLVWSHPDDDAALTETQNRQLQRLQADCRAAGIEWMLELVPPLDMDRSDETLRRGVVQAYENGLRPDWWKLPGLASRDGWGALATAIEQADPYCRGVIVLGLNEEIPKLADTLALAGQAPICKGFAVGRSIFGNAAEAWFAGQIGDADAIEDMAARYRQCCDAYLSGRKAA